MIIGKHGLRALGLSLLAVIGLMAVGAVGAGATTGELKILNAAETVLSELNATLNGEIDLLNVLQVPGINLEIDCTKLTVNEGVYLASDNVGHMKIVYHECKVYQLSPLTELTGCEIYPSAADRTAGTNKGLIQVQSLILILLHTGESGEKTVIRAKPSAKGGSFSTVFYKNCPVGSSVIIAGGQTLVAHDNPETHLVKHLFEEATGSFKLDQLLYGGNNMNIVGSLWIFLTGEHTGRKWGIV